MTTPAPLPRLPPMPKPRPATLPWRLEQRVAIRDGLACRVCDLPLVADGERRVVRVDPAGDDAEGNLALLCDRCSAHHRDHPQPIPGLDERMERVC